MQVEFEPMLAQSQICSYRGSTLVIVLLVLGILTLLGTTVLRMTGMQQYIAKNRETSSQALYLAEAGIEHARARMRRVEFSDFSNKLGSGNYSVCVGAGSSGAISSEVGVNSTGCAGQVEHEVRAEVGIQNNRVPVVPDGALAVYTECSKFSIYGNPEIDGQDYLPPANFYCSGALCDSAGFASLNQITGLYSRENFDLQNSGTDLEEKLTPDSPQFGGGKYTHGYWKQLAANLIPLADDVYNGTVSDLELGSRSNPRIVVLGPNAAIQGNVDGAGILLVKQGAKFNGDVHYEGQVVLISQGGNMEPFSSLEADIYGSVAVVGEKLSQVGIGGNCDIIYSKNALQNANDINGLVRTRVLSWKDLY